MKLRVVPIKTNPIKRRRKKKATRRASKPNRGPHFLVQGIAPGPQFLYLRHGGRWAKGTKNAAKYSSQRAAADAMHLHAKKRPRSLQAAQVVLA